MLRKLQNETRFRFFIVMNSNPNGIILTMETNHATILINSELKNHIESKVFPEYQKNEPAHDLVYLGAIVMEKDYTQNIATTNYLTALMNI